MSPSIVVPTALALLAFAVPWRSVRAMPCPNEPPRLFPDAGAHVSADARFVFLVRREQAGALKALEGAHLALTDGRRPVPLRRDRHDVDLRSDAGERVLIFLPAHPLQVGHTYRLAHLPELPAPWRNLVAASWTVAQKHATAAPTIPPLPLGRTQCSSLPPDARICRITLGGSNTSRAPALLQARLTPIDPKTGKKGNTMTFVDIIAPGESLALHNNACDAEMAGMPGADYDAELRLVNTAGRSAAPWRTKVHVIDMNEEMGQVPSIGIDQ